MGFLNSTNIVEINTLDNIHHKCLIYYNMCILIVYLESHILLILIKFNR